MASRRFPAAVRDAILSAYAAGCSSRELLAGVSQARKASECRRAPGRCTCGVHVTEIDAVVPLLARLDSFRNLEPGWDSYGAQPIDPRAIAKAQELLNSLTVVPTACGGVQVEASAEGVEIEEEIGPDGRIVEGEPAGHPWTYCVDALPESRELLEVAWVRRGRILRGYALFMADGFRSSLPGCMIEEVYAWRPLADDAPPLRPADHQYLTDHGVPPEWLAPEEG